jgi:hypothetical protein
MRVKPRRTVNRWLGSYYDRLAGRRSAISDELPQAPDADQPPEKKGLLSRSGPG